MFLNQLSKHLKEYADKARQSAFSDTWEKELLNISAKVHVSRLEALKTQLRQQVEMLFAEQADVMQKSLGESYKSDYYHSAYEIQKGFNVGWDMPSIDQNAINTVLSKPWAPDGYNFSERIWNNKEKLLSELNTVMTQNIMTGAGPQKAIDTLAKKMNTSRSNAGRLVMTESAYFSSLGRQQCFKDLGVEKYEYVATLDRKTSETCRDLDGKVFEIDDYKPGTNAPPMHCWCRSCIVPYFDDMEMLGKRAARDPETGKTILVPEDMTYRKWEKTYANTADRTSEIASAGRKKVFIEEENIDKLPYFKYYGKNKEQSIKINNVQKELLNDSRKENNSNETVYVLDQEGKRQEKVYGTSDAVSLPLNVRNMLDSGKNMMLLHNHPAGSSFSVYDISCLLDYKGLSTITLVTNGCDRIEALTKTAKYDHEVVAGFYNKLLKKVKKNLDEFEKNVELHDRFVQIFLSYVDEKGYISWRK